MRLRRSPSVAPAAEAAFQRHHALRCLPWDLLHATLMLVAALLHVCMVMDLLAGCQVSMAPDAAFFKGTLASQWLLGSRPLQQAAPSQFVEVKAPAVLAVPACPYQQGGRPWLESHHGIDHSPLSESLLLRMPLAAMVALGCCQQLSTHHASVGEASLF